jgi:pyruvate/2-oxoglutarate dehydrogenase complex dihydrolipoamide dehydrogenase (E3) component
MKYDLIVIGSGPGGYVAAVKGAQLSWTTEAETDENTVTDDDNTQTGGNGGGGETPGGELEG